MGLSETLEEAIGKKEGISPFVSKALSRLSLTAKGAASHWLDRHFPSYPNLPNLEERVADSHQNEKPTMFFTIWKPLGYEETVKLISELRKKYDFNGSLNFGLGLFVRPMGDVLSEGFNFSFDTSVYDGFLRAVKETETRVFFIVSGDQWTEAQYGISPLLEKLAEDTDNRMFLNNGKPVPVRMQPSFNNLFGLVGNAGVRYLSYHSAIVNYFRDQNFRQAANFISNFYRENPEIFLGLSLRNETDFSGWWVIHGNYALRDRKEYFADCGNLAMMHFSKFLREGLKDEYALVHQAMQRAGVERTGRDGFLKALDFAWIVKARAYARHDIHILRSLLNNPGFVNKPLDYEPVLFGLWQSFRIETIKSRLALDATIAKNAGIPESRIYTCQSFEDSARRASPVETAIIPGSQIGITAWGTGNTNLYSEIRDAAKREGKKWMVVITNPLSENYQEVLESLKVPFLMGAGGVGIYNLAPHFSGYPIRGPLLKTDAAIDTLTKKPLTPLRIF